MFQNLPRVTNKKIKPLLVLPLLSAFLWFLSMPPVGLGFFSWFALVPLLFFLRSEKVSDRQAVLGSALAGFFYALAVLWPAATLNSWWWVSNSGFFYENRESILFLLLIPGSFYAGSLFYIFFGAVFRKFARASISSAVLLSLFWVVLEVIRIPLVLGFTWGVVGYNLHDYLFLRQTAFYFGVWGLSFLVIFSNITIFFAVKNLDFRKEGFFAVGRAVVKSKVLWSFVTVLALANLYGHLVVERGVSFKEEAKVAVIYSDLKTQESGSREVYFSYMDRVREAVDKEALFVFLPENFFPSFVVDKTTGLPLTYNHPGFDSKYLFDQLKDFSNLNPEVSFIIGLHTRDLDRNKRNSVALLEGGEIVDYYDKRRLLPFSEKGFVAGDYKKDSLVSGLEPETEKIKVLVCSEVIFPYLARGDGSDFIVVSSNDGVFDSPVVGEQNHIMAKLRAVENRQYLARSVKGGVSAIFDPFGKVVSSSRYDEIEGVGLIMGSVKY